MLLFIIPASGSLFVSRYSERLAQLGSGVRIVALRCCVEREEFQWVSLCDIVDEVLQTICPAKSDVASGHVIRAE